jgi:hypothetical protein
MDGKNLSEGSMWGAERLRSKMGSTPELSLRCSAVWGRGLVGGMGAGLAPLPTG